MAELSQTQVLNKFFFDPAEKLPPSEKMKQLKALSPEDKLELAQGAAKNLGLTQAEVAFPLA